MFSIIYSSMGTMAGEINPIIVIHCLNIKSQYELHNYDHCAIRHAGHSSVSQLDALDL